MKKFRLLILLCLFPLLLTACGEEGSENPEAFTPLFRFSVAGLEDNSTKLFYCPKSQGYFYLHGMENGGFLGGFVSHERSISGESVVESSQPLSFALLREKAQDRATLLTDQGLFHALLKENGSESVPLPENISFQNAVFYDDLTLIAENESLLLLCPVDFKETFVLAQKKNLPEFAKVITVTQDGGLIWYARKNSDGAYTGISCLEYGKSQPFKQETFAFDSFRVIGETGVLFTRLLPDGGALYTYRDLESGKASSLTSDTVFSGIVCDPEGNTFCGSIRKDGSGEIQVFDFKKGTKTGVYRTEHGKPSDSMAIDSTGTELMISVSMEKDEVLGVLDLTKLSL